LYCNSIQSHTYLLLGLISLRSRDTLLLDAFSWYIQILLSNVNYLNAVLICLVKLISRTWYLNRSSIDRLSIRGTFMFESHCSQFVRRLGLIKLFLIPIRQIFL
jgi:hypothetical protein